MMRRVLESLASTLSRAVLTGPRGSALREVRLTFVIAIAAFLYALQTKADFWVQLLLGIGVVVAFALNCGSFVYLLLNNPDALRSEPFTIDKMRIEKGLIGDTNSGFAQVEAEAIEVKALPDGSQTEER